MNVTSPFVSAYSSLLSKVAFAVNKSLFHNNGRNLHVNIIYVLINDISQAVIRERFFPKIDRD